MTTGEGSKACIFPLTSLVTPDEDQPVAVALSLPVEVEVELVLAVPSLMFLANQCLMVLLVAELVLGVPSLMGLADHLGVPTRDSNTCVEGRFWCWEGLGDI